jgi:hypothetical protein
MDPGSPRKLMSLYIAAVVAVGMIISAGSLTLWAMSGGPSEPHQEGELHD